MENVPTHMLDKLLFVGKVVIFVVNDDFRADTPRGVQMIRFVC